MNKISPAGLKHIKDFEGLRLKAYVCPAGVLTIGYGHTGKDVYPNLQITVERANNLLKNDLARFEKCVNAAVKVPLKQGQYDALVSFCFNVGESAFRTSTLLKELNKGNHTQVPAQLRRWTRGNPANPPLEGLIRRREAEVTLWNS